ncbi:hypothetical protein BT93_L3070 [Corymbia citriodora subsp. variegata]|uniref:Uncharacterized protein n=1 Tax=Corymbia citriodora subsp. variegata TaxID=360336 RepID=A0A8T0CHX8_CORYI|nr:hypothetical protein BT93_L3070 [Corymbia citriodora subsp. variegata]
MRSIYRVPAHITNLNPEAFQPQVVSFGPYHHGKDHLLPMEEHKRRARHHFIERSGKPPEHFFDSLRELDQKWKQGSSEGTTDPFLELMITDGCFMLEILRFIANMVNDYAFNDPIFSDHGKLYQMMYIRVDMLMLENQLPMLVLDRLVNVGNNVLKGDGIIEWLILCFCSPSKPITSLGGCRHVLDVLWESMLMKLEKKNEVGRHYDPESFQLASATELSEHGILFKKSETNSLNAISFAGGVLTLPSIWVDDNRKSMFLNLMAFERSPAGAGNEVMSYIYFMDHLISNGQDIALLRTQGIIVNILYSDEAAAKMFGSLAKSVIIGPNCSFIDVFEEVNKYYNKRWNMWRANFIRTYFANPWVTSSLIAAVFLFALTTIHTVYSVLGYYK